MKKKRKFERRASKEESSESTYPIKAGHLEKKFSRPETKGKSQDKQNRHKVNRNAKINNAFIRQVS